MKKKILKVAFVAEIALVSGLNVFNAQKSEMLSDVALANVEALAAEEHGTICNGFYYVCQSELSSFLAEKERNCDVDNVGYAVLDC